MGLTDKIGIAILCAFVLFSVVRLFAAPLKLASKVLGMGPKECTVYAERLYLKGYISYPRTESSAYPEHYDIL